MGHYRAIILPWLLVPLWDCLLLIWLHSYRPGRAELPGPRGDWAASFRGRRGQGKKHTNIITMYE